MLKNQLKNGQVVVYTQAGVSYLGHMESGFRNNLKLVTADGQVAGKLKDNKKRGNPTCSLVMKQGKSLPTIEIVDIASEAQEKFVVFQNLKQKTDAAQEKLEKSAAFAEFEQTEESRMQVIQNMNDLDFKKQVAFAYIKRNIWNITGVFGISCDTLMPALLDLLKNPTPDTYLCIYQIISGDWMCGAWCWTAIHEWFDKHVYDDTMAIVMSEYDAQELEVSQ